MNSPNLLLRLVIGTVAWIAAVPGLRGESTNASTYPIDLPAALRLAGAQNLDVQLAREHVREAEANRDSAVERFFPWIAPGVAYHRRDGLAQSVPSGVVSDAHFQSYAPGATIGAQWELGDAIYGSLAAKQLVKASNQALDAERQDSVLSAARGYFELSKARALTGVAKQAVETSADYERQLSEAVGAGIAFKGDELRVRTQTERFEIALRRALERQRIVAAELARTLHLDPAMELVPQDSGLAPITLFETNSALDPLVQRALRSRPELQRADSLMFAARDVKNGALYGSLVPSIGGQVFAGGFGGGPDHGSSTFGGTEDYLVGLNWRIGPGGLFDSGRINAGKARLAATRLDRAKLEDAITAEVVSSLVRVQSLSDQAALAQRNLSTATETLRLTRQRREFGVGIVLEDIDAQQSLTEARADYVSAIADYNKAQYELDRAVGGETGR